MAEEIQNTDQTVESGDKKVQEIAEQARTFSQEEVNGLVAKESKKAQEQIFKSLGFEDIKSAKEGFEKLKAWEDSQKSESEKSAEALTAKEQELAKALSDNKTLSAQLSALKQGVIADSVDDVIALSERLVSDEVSIDDAIKQILTKYPQFGTKQEQDEEKPKPTFATAGNPTAVSAGGEVDPFQSIIDSYRKKKG
nr:MAG TPA: Major capsid protein [Caudoviricetes sp.]